MRFNLPIFIGTIILLIALGAAFTLGYLVSQLIRGFLPVDAFTFLLTLFLFVTITVLIYLLLRLVRRQQPPPESPSPSPQLMMERPLEAPFIRRRPVAPQPNQNLPNHELQSRVIQKLAGDEAAAEQLVNRLKRNYPGRSENWYWLRALHDLDRNGR